MSFCQLLSWLGTVYLLIDFLCKLSIFFILQSTSHYLCNNALTRCQAAGAPAVEAVEGEGWEWSGFQAAAWRRLVQAEPRGKVSWTPAVLGAHITHRPGLVLGARQSSSGQGCVWQSSVRSRVKMVSSLNLSAPGPSGSSLLILGKSIWA